VSPTMALLSSSHNSQITVNVQPTDMIGYAGSRRSQKYKKRAKSGGDSSADASSKSTSLAKRFQHRDLNMLSQNHRQKSTGGNLI
jgi:hypothetical protein